MNVSDIMTKKVITLTPDTTIMDAVNVLSKNGISGAPVIGDNDKLMGIVTEYDIMKRLIEFYIPSYVALLAETEAGGDRTPRKVMSSVEVRIRDIMTIKVITVLEHAEAVEAARVITRHDINPLPVLDAKGKLVGIVSRSDIVKYAVNVFPRVEKPRAERRGGVRKKSKF